MKPATAIAIAISATVATQAAGQERLPRGQAVEDLRYFARALDETHPDPYTALGGKVAFKLRIQNLLAAVPESGLSRDALYALLVPFVAELGDGHTWLHAPPRAQSGPSRVLALTFAVATDAIFVSGATSPYAPLIGDRLVAVDGRPLVEFESLASQILPSENAYGLARTTVWAVQYARYARRVLDRNVDSLRLRLRDSSGAEIERWIPYLGPTAAQRVRPDRLVPELGEDSGAIWWQFLSGQRVGYLRMAAIEGREAFESARGRADLPQYVAAYYRRYLHRAEPLAIDSAVAGVPCFTASVAHLLDTMRTRSSEYLIVDLRGNDGGWSALGLPLYLLAYGDDYVDHVFPEVWVDVASPRYLELNGWTVNDLHREWGAEYEPGDYRRSAPSSPRAGRSDAEYSVDLQHLGCGLADWYRRLRGRPSYRPAVIVLVDPGTFSAAFGLAYHLGQLGAVLVGVPPAQAGNAFTNVVQVELPNSHLAASIARSEQLFFPNDTAQARTLRLDFPMTWNLYARYGFDAQSELRYTLDLISEGRIRPPAPR